MSCAGNGVEANEGGKELRRKLRRRRFERNMEAFGLYLLIAVPIMSVFVVLQLVAFNLL